MRTHRYIAICLLAFASSATAEQFSCIPDKMTGFAYDATTKQWDYAKFKTEFKYVIAPGKEGRSAFTLSKTGETDPIGYCKGSFNDAGFLFCETYGGDFRFNRKNGRYLMAFTYGYYNVGTGSVVETDADSGTPMLEIGKCSPF